MKIELDSGVEGKWAKAGKDIKDGDRIKIKDAGQVTNSGFKDEDGTPKPQYVFKIVTQAKEEFNVAFNRTSRNTLGRGYGTETEEWIGKVAQCFVVKQMIGDGLKNVLYLAPDGWIMTDDGEFIDPNGDEEVQRPSVSPPKTPRYNVEEADRMAEDSPF